MLVLLLLAASPTDDDDRHPGPHRLDPAPARWGPWQQGQRLGLEATTRFDPGQYLDVWLWAEQADPGNAPYVRFTRDGLFGRPCYRLELTGPTGAVPVTSTGGFSSWARGDGARLRLRPPPGSPGWPYFPPGRYRLTATLDAPRDRFDPVGWVGRLTAEAVAFDVSPGPRRGFTVASAVAVLADLASPDPVVWRSAVARAVAGRERASWPAAVGGMYGPAEAFRGRYTAAYAAYRLSVDDDWRDAVRLAGPTAVGPLIDHARPEAAAHLRHLAIESLGLTGPDARSLAHLARLAESQDRDEKGRALHALGQLGPNAVPTLVRVARDERQDQAGRSAAVAGLETAGTAETVGAALADALRTDAGLLPCWAAGVAERMGCRAVLPELRRLAATEVPANGSFDLRRDRLNNQSAALRAFARLSGEPGPVRAALDDPNTRGKAAFLLGAVGDRSDVPTLIRLLDDPEWYVRAQADVGLRGLAVKPEGVGFDATTRREPKLWADWFAAHPPR